MKSAGNGGILKGILQVLHIHILFVAPLGACHMAQPCTDQHQGRVTIRETAHHTGAAANLPVQPLNDIVGADTAPVFTGEIAVDPSSVTPCACHYHHSITRNSPWGQFRLQTVLKFFRRRIGRLFFFSSSLSFSLPLPFHSRGAAVCPFLLP